MNPGFVDTQMYESVIQKLGCCFFMGKICSGKSLSSKEGCQTHLFCMLAPWEKLENGKYYENCQVKKVSKFAEDDENMARIWDITIQDLQINLDLISFNKTFKLIVTNQKMHILNPEDYDDEEYQSDNVSDRKESNENEQDAQSQDRKSHRKISHHVVDCNCHRCEANQTPCKRENLHKRKRTSYPSQLNNDNNINDLFIQKTNNNGLDNVTKLNIVKEFENEIKLEPDNKPRNSNKNELMKTEENESNNVIITNILNIDNS